MLTGIKDHEGSLIDSQRFYYNNYEYYNDYEDIEKDYQNDLSKIKFNLCRKSKGSIILKDAHSSNYNQSTNRLIRQYQPKRSAHCSYINQQFLTLDDLLYKFTMAFHEQNYSDIKMDRKECKDRYEIIILQYMLHYFKEQFEQSEQSDYYHFSQILQTLRTIGEQTQNKLGLLYEKADRSQTEQFLERWFAFEKYWHYLIQVKLQAETKDQKPQNYYLFQFCQYFKYFLNQISTGNMRNILLLAQPQTPSLSQSVHPLSIPLSFTIQKQPNTPKILFLNLDGRETYLNLRVVRTLPSNVRYISIFQQPSGLEMGASLTKGCNQFAVDAQFVNMNSAHSELLFRQIRSDSSDQNAANFNQNIILYPLNSIYLRKAYSLSKVGSSLEERRLPVLDSRIDLKWLWKQIVSRQAEEWNPELVIVSYNGFLNIGQQDFAQIIKDLTILSDHRIILFTNMTGLFKHQQQMEDENEEEEQKERVDLIKEFLSLYVPYKYDNVDEEKYFDNLSHFIKLSSGTYSLKKRMAHTPQSRFSLGRRLLYLERMASLPQFANILYTGSQASNIDRLFKEFSKKEIQESQKQSEWWLKKIEQVQKDFLQRSPEQFLKTEIEMDDEEELKTKKYRNLQIVYRYQALKSELQLEQCLIHDQQLDFSSEFPDYLGKNKQKLLLQNLETYHYKRVYTGQQEQRTGRLKCYRFSLNQGDGEQILLQRYSQVITDDKKTRIFIVNYRTTQQKHIILQGQITERGSVVKMKRVLFRLQQSLQDMAINIEREKEPIYLNYSHCFIKDKLYLFWPQQWNIVQQIRRKLLGLQYSPPHVNYMLRLFYNPQERAYLVERLRWIDSQTIPPVPRRGCVSLEYGSESKFYIFGGIYDSRLDYYTTSSVVNIATIQDDTFSIQAVPKRRDKQNKNNSCLKPKMNYRIEKGSRISTTDQIGGSVLSGGYGRSFTNFHTIFSYENYNIANQLDGLKIMRTESRNFRMTKLSHPLIVASVGRFFVGSQGEAEDKFSDLVMDLYLAEGKQERNGEREVISVLEDQMRVRQFKSDHKRNYLFGWDRTIRDRIYVPHCWSPELQIISNGRLYLVYTALKTEKSNNYNVGNFLIPKEQDLISLCLDEDRLLLLSNSPVLHSLDNRPNNYILYEGSLANMTDLVTRRELPMHERFEFKGSSRQQQSLRYKTLFTVDDKIFVLGGLSKEPNEREDYILERYKDKLKKKIRKLQCNDTLQLTSPVVVKHNNGFLLYSIVLEQKCVPKGDNAQSIEDFWRLKIQTFTPIQSCQQQTLICGPLLLYHIDFQNGRIVSRKPQFQEPKIVKIVPYTRFSSTALREIIQKIYIKINRLQQQKYQESLELLRLFLKERDQGKISSLLFQHYHQGTTFKNLLKMFDFLLDDEKRERQNLENQELVRDFRALSSLMNKHMLQCALELQNTDSRLYRFVMEDRSSRKVKYIAIGPLLTTRLRFLRIRYKHQLSICLNEVNQEQLFFNTNILGCQQIAKERSKGFSQQLEEQPITKKIVVSYKI